MQRSHKFSIFILLLCFLNTYFLQLLANIEQERKDSLTNIKLVEIQWLDDTLDIGEPAKIKLTSIKSDKYKIWLIDTLKAFAPFKIVNTSTLGEDTENENDNEYKSTIFEIISFEIDSVQKIKIPFVFRVNNDSTIIQSYSNEDSIYFKTRIPLTKKSLRLKTDLYLSPLESIKSYLVLIIIGIIFIFGTLGFILYKPIKILWRKYKLEVEFKKVIKQLDSVRARNKDHRIQILKINSIWKNYYSFIFTFSKIYLKKNIMSLTSNEIENEHILNTEIGLDRLTTLVELCKVEENLYYAKVDYTNEQIKELIANLQHILKSEHNKRKSQIH